MSTVTSVSAFLAGFSLAAVMVIAGAPRGFRWPGGALLALTVASVVLIVAAQESRQGARYYERSTERARHVIWGLYHAGVIVLLAGLGAALAPPGGAGTQVSLRWAAMWAAFLAAFAEVLMTIPPAARVIKRLAKRVPGISGRFAARNDEDLTELLRDRQAWQPWKQDRERFWCFGVDGAARLVIVPEKDGFLMYRADRDKSWPIPRIGLVEEWLEANEADHTGPGVRRVEFRDSFMRAREKRKGPGGQADAGLAAGSGGAAAGEPSGAGGEFAPVGAALEGGGAGGAEDQAAVAVAAGVSLPASGSGADGSG